jgi:hypothetical protein
VSADGTQLEPDPAEQSVIELARRLRAQQASLREVAAMLEERGMRSRTGRTFSPVQVARMVGETSY